MPTMSLRVRLTARQSCNILISCLFSSDSQCRQFAVCWASRAAAERGGQVGVSLASPLAENMAARLWSKYQESEATIMAAKDNGIRGGNCGALHPCSKPMKTIWTSLQDQLIVYLGLK